MTDLIERLRAHAALHRGLGFDDDDEQAQWARDLLTAAEEIERLRTRLEIDQRHPIDGIEARDATIREQDKEIERLRAALRWEQHRAERQGTHGDGCADWGPAHYECAIRERDDHARWRADLADKLHDRETTISAAWEALRSAGVHSEAAIDDGIRLLRRQIAEAQKEIHNLNWALGTEGYDQMATPEEQAEHEAAVRAHHDVLERLEEGKRAYEAMKLDARRYRDWLRGGANIPPESTRWPRWEVRHWDGRHWNTLFAEALDTSIDAAMGGSDAG